MNESLPQECIGDEAHRAVRAALSAIPFVGGAAVEYFNRLFAPPLQRRRDAWLKALAERLSKLEQEGRVKVEDLQNNEEFISTVMQASQVAVGNHQKEKLEALRNAILNTAVGKAPEDSKRGTFLAFVDVLSVWHLRLLSFLIDPVAWFKANGKSVPSYGTTSSLLGVIQVAMPELASQGDFLDLVVSDLTQRKLIAGGGIMTMMSADGWKAKRTTSLGDEFARFISCGELV